jgi:hypothetical protein
MHFRILYPVSRKVAHSPHTVPLAPPALELKSADAPIGTISSSSPCATSVGTVILLRSSRKSVREGFDAVGVRLAPPIMPWRHHVPITP